jgi:hypothetical protein
MMKFKIKTVTRPGTNVLEKLLSVERKPPIKNFGSCFCVQYDVDGLNGILSEIEISVLCTFYAYSPMSKIDCSIEHIGSVLGITSTEIMNACDYLQKVGLIEYKYKEKCDSIYMNETAAACKYLVFNIHCQFDEDEEYKKYILIPTILYLRLLSEKAVREL